MCDERKQNFLSPSFSLFFCCFLHCTLTEGLEERLRLVERLVSRSLPRKEKERLAETGVGQSSSGQHGSRVFSECIGNVQRKRKVDANSSICQFFGKWRVTEVVA